jgi:hypothetical protein
MLKKLFKECLFAVGLTSLICLIHCADYTAENPFDTNGVAGNEDPFLLSGDTDSTEVTLSWNRLNVSNFEKYILYRGTDSTDLESYKEITSKNTTEYQDKNASEDSIYYYQMSLVTGGKESNKSDIIKVKVPIKPELTLEKDTLDFGTSINSLDQIIKNAGSGNLAWSITMPDKDGLILPSPSSGTVTSDSSATVTFSVARSKIEDADIYMAEIIVTSQEGGNKSFYVRVEVP